MIKIYICSYLNPISDTKCEFVRDGALVVNNNIFIDKGTSFKILKKYQDKNAQLINFSGSIIMPSFFDMHFHWVQDDVRLMPKDSLLEWLSQYTWPYEAKFKSIEYTKRKVEKFGQELLAVGTLGGACYASIHPHTVGLALKEFKGDFIIGNVLMTMNSPKYLVQSEKNAIDTVFKLSTRFKSKYAVTPRFAITTSPYVMKKSASIAKKNKSFIQTHLSETEGEIDFVKSIYKKIKGFEKVKSYTEIYHKCGILSPKTIMGHGIYLSKDELTLLRKTRTAIAHCPTSNAPIKEFGLGSGLFNFKLIEKNKIPWALGSDIGGGPYLSMFDVMRSFVEQNKKAKLVGATYVKAFYRATLSGAKILELDKTLGSIGKNKIANFIVVKAPKKKTGESSEDIIESIIKPIYKDRTTSTEIVQKTFHHGELVYSRNSKSTGQ